MAESSGNGLRNTIVGGLITVTMAFIGAWIQVNNRIAVLEVQMDAYSKVQQKSETDLDKIMEKISDIQVKVTRLNTEFEIEHQNQR